MVKIFGSPNRYIQGPEVLKTHLDFVRQLGSHALLLTDEMVWQICGQTFAARLQPKSKVTTSFLSGESSEENVARLIATNQGLGVDFVVALGGGKVIDVGKALSQRLDLPIAILPTVASTDAPTSAISVIYDQSGRFERYSYHYKNPELVLVDTAIIIEAPAFLLVSGIADALATFVEVRTVLEQGQNNLFGGKPTLAAIAIAERCQQVLFEYGEEAVKDNQQKKLSPAFEAIVEANTLLSGLGFESGGLAGAHAIQNGLSVIDGKVKTLSHGQKVAFGTLTQLVLEKRPQKELLRYLEFYQKLGLPTTLSQLYIDNQDLETLRQVGIQATVQSETSHYLAETMTTETIVAGLLAADTFGREMKKK